MATSYHRPGWQTVSDASPLAPPRTAESNPAGSSAGSKDWAGLRAATVVPAARRVVRSRAETHVLPTSVPVPATRTRRLGRTAQRARASMAARRGARASTSWRTWSSVCAAETVTRNRLVPAGTVGGRMAGTHKPSASRAADASRARCSVPRITGMMGLEGWSRVPGPPGWSPLADPRHQVGQAPDQRVPFGERRTPSAASAAAASAGREPGGEDVGPGGVDHEVDHVAGAGQEAAQGAQGLRQRAHPHQGELGVRREGGGEVRAQDGVGLIEEEQGPAAPAQGGDLLHRGRIAVHGEHRVGDDDGRGGRGPPPAGRRGAPRRSGGRSTPVSGTA